MMWLNRLFLETPIDFEKRCKNRIVVGKSVMLLGVLTLGALACFGGRFPILYLEPHSREVVNNFYFFTGAALVISGALTIWRNVRYLRDPSIRKEREIAETDERNRMMGLRCWAFSGYVMFLLLYIGVLFSGFISVTVMKVLLGVMGLYALLLIGFRVLLKRCM